ncbi:MAG: DUF1697 domain-containing protein [Planctomycetes bacterium]|nr:DUF1697 domain-containing protein [Planctomycetota bacterium]
MQQRVIDNPKFTVHRNTLAASLGFREPRNHVQGGNLVFAAATSATACTDALERAIAAQFGLDVPVVVSTAAELQTALLRCPFAAAVDARPNLVHIGFCRTKFPAVAAAELGARAQEGERIAVVGPHVWIDYESGVARSKLTPTVLDRCAGAPVTMRNARTLRAVLGMLDAG